MPTLYSETIGFSPVVVGAYVALGVASLFALLQVPTPWPLLLVAVLFLLVGACFGRLVVELDEELLVVRFGYLGWPEQRIPRVSVRAARVVSYRPIRQFGGWGIRVGKLEDERTSVYSVRGSRGLLIELSEPRRIAGARTQRFLIGTLEPDSLAAFLSQ